MLPSSRALLRDMLLVGLTRILNQKKYIDYINNPLLGAEAIIHLNIDVNEYKVDNKIVERMLSVHPLGVLVYLDKIGLTSAGLKVFVKMIKFVIKRPDILALAISYTGSKKLYENIFASIFENEKNARNILTISILLDAMTFRYGIDEAITFTMQMIEKFMANRTLPDILRRMHLSTILATKSLYGEDIEEIHEVLIKGLRLNCDDITYLQSAPIIAKNLYISEDKELSKDVFIRLKELKTKILNNLSPFSFITPTPPSRITKTLNKIVWIIDRIVLVFNTFSRSKKFSDEKFAIEYLNALFQESKDPTILAVLTKFLIRSNPKNAKNIISNYISTSKKILKNEYEILYHHLGSIYALKSTNTTARKIIEEEILQKPDKIKHFITGLYEESLKQYPLRP